MYMWARHGTALLRNLMITATVSDVKMRMKKDMNLVVESSFERLSIVYVTFSAKIFHCRTTMCNTKYDFQLH